MGAAATIVDTVTTRSDSGGNCDLAGTWRPTRASCWYNRVHLGKHADRARMASTYLVINSDGSGNADVGGAQVKYKNIIRLAPGQYMATASITLLLWSANDGNFTLLEDGTLEVRYPSSGITEYWQREDGRGREILANARRSSQEEASHSQKSQNTSTGSNIRPVRLVMRRVTGIRLIPWHWGIQVGDDIYELNGSIAIYGPKGVIAANSPLMVGPTNGTRLSQFDGYLDLQFNGRSKSTRKSSDEIETFSKQWVKAHPIYRVEGPNCQTYAEDLYTFLCGENLPYAKVGDLKPGPEKDARVVWLNK